jgi:hypothetical protein
VYTSAGFPDQTISKTLDFLCADIQNGNTFTILVKNVSAETVNENNEGNEIIITDYILPD